MLAAIAIATGCSRPTTNGIGAVPSRASNTSPPPASVAAAEMQAADSGAATDSGSRLLPPPETLTDPFITARIRTAILADPAMAGSDVSVDTHQGVVSLAGQVASQEQAGIASAHAQRQDGVMRVDTHLAATLN